MSVFYNMKKIILSSLPKTWIFDVDGTLVIHNGHLRPEGDSLLPGVKDFFDNVDDNDVIVLLTARTAEEIPELKRFLNENGIRYNEIIPNMPTGERILINDCKPSGLKTAYAINKTRDSGLEFSVEIDESL